MEGWQLPASIIFSHLLQSWDIGCMTQYFPQFATMIQSMLGLCGWKRLIHQDHVRCHVDSDNNQYRSDVTRIHQAFRPWGTFHREICFHTLQLLSNLSFQKRWIDQVLRLHNALSFHLYLFSYSHLPPSISALNKPSTSSWDHNASSSSPDQ